MPLQATCHCTAITLTLPIPPSALSRPISEYHCSICHRYGALWAIYQGADVLVTAEADVPTRVYIRQDLGEAGEEGKVEAKMEFYFCSRCGCVTHWWQRGAREEAMGVNVRMCGREVVEGCERRVVNAGK